MAVADNAGRQRHLAAYIDAVVVVVVVVVEAACVAVVAVVVGIVAVVAKQVRSAFAEAVA